MLCPTAHILVMYPFIGIGWKRVIWKESESGFNAVADANSFNKTIQVKSLAIIDLC